MPTLHLRSFGDLAYVPVETRMQGPQVLVYAGDTLARLTNNFYPAVLAKLAPVAEPAELPPPPNAGAAKKKSKKKNPNAKAGARYVI